MFRGNGLPPLRCGVVIGRDGIVSACPPRLEHLRKKSVRDVLVWALAVAETFTFYYNEEEQSSQQERIEMARTRWRGDDKIILADGTIMEMVSNPDVLPHFKRRSD